MMLTQHVKNVSLLSVFVLIGSVAELVRVISDAGAMWHTVLIAAVLAATVADVLYTLRRGTRLLSNGAWAILLVILGIRDAIEAANFHGLERAAGFMFCGFLAFGALVEVVLALRGARGSLEY